MAPRTSNRRFVSTVPDAANFTAIWNEIHSLRADLTEARGTVAEQARTITSLNQQLAKTSEDARRALIQAAAPTEILPTPAGEGGAAGSGGVVDDGLGAQGCAQCGPDGHVAPGSPLTAVTAGMIVCGTGQEYSSLRAPAVDQATRDANVVELLLRCIWHLQQAGFTAGRQINPSGAISSDKLTVQIAGEMRVYDIFSLVTFDTEVPMHMLQIGGAQYLADPGVADP